MAPVGAKGRVRLLVLASTYPRWQGDHEPGFVHELCKRLVDDFEVVVLCPHARGALPVEHMDGVQVVRYRYAPAAMETLVNDGGIVANLKRARWKYLLLPGFVLSQWWSAARLLRSRDIEVIHAHWLLPQGLIAAFLQRIRGRSASYVVTSHGADLYALRGEVLGKIKRLVARGAAKVTVVSDAMRLELQALGVRPEQVGVLPMGVDLQERFSVDPRVERSGDELLFVGRLVEKKGLRHLIDALPLVLQQHPSAFLTVAGFGPEEDALRRQVDAAGLQSKVRFVGAVPQADLPALYRRARLFVAPFVQAKDGDREGLGLVTVEAMGCGCQAIVGNVEAVRELVSRGALVEVVDPRDTAALARSILQGLRQPRQEDAIAASVRWFDWEQRAQAYRTLLRPDRQSTDAIS